MRGVFEISINRDFKNTWHDDSLSSCLALSQVESMLRGGRVHINMLTEVVCPLCSWGSKQQHYENGNIYIIGNHNFIWLF
jgi:hypothetical protein